MAKQGINRGDFVVYRIKNIINGFVYIGSSKNFPDRKRQHIEDLFNKKHHNYKLQEDFNKYGIAGFKFEILKYFKKHQEMIIFEYQLINSIDRKYNIQTKDYAKEGLEKENKNVKVLVQKSRVLIVCKKEKWKHKKPKMGIVQSKQAENKPRIYKRNGVEIKK
jgi:group I intron endonuclease